MTIEDAINYFWHKAMRHSENAIAYWKGRQTMLAETSVKCAADYEQLAKWLEELKQRRAVDRWIPCSERLPDALKNVIVCTDINTVTVAWINDEGWTFADTGCGHTENWTFDDVKYWMPLPEPPEGGD